MINSEMIDSWWLWFALEITVKSTLILGIGSLLVCRKQTLAAIGHCLAVLGSQIRNVANKRANIAVLGALGFIAVLLSTLQLGHKASAQANANSQVNATDKRDQCIIEGIIRTESREPAVGAKIEVILHNHPGGNYFVVPEDEKVERFETLADENGKFLLKVPRLVNRIPIMTALVASLAGEFPIIEQIDLRKAQNQVGLQFTKSKVFSFQILGGTGPLTGLSPRLESVQFPGGEFIASPHPLGHEAVNCWPAIQAAKDGMYEVRLPASLEFYAVSINDSHTEAMIATVHPSKGPAQIKLDYAHTLIGTVEDQAGNPVENVKVVTADRLHREVRTDKNGKFRFVRGETSLGSNHLHFYPPAGSDLLYRVKEWYWRPDTFETEETFILKKGIVIEGKVIDAKTSKPIVGAQLSYQFDGENEYARKNTQSPQSSMEPRFTTDQDGKFRMSAIGRGKLQVRQPNFDYKLASKIQYPWMSGEAFRGFAYEIEFDLTQDTKLEPLTIELEQGERIRLQVQRPDGTAAKCMAMTPSYRFGEIGMPVMMPFHSIDGIVELPGAAVNCEVLLLDSQGKCGLVFHVPEHANGPIALKLNPFGTAMVRIVDSAGKPNVGYQTNLFLTLRGIPVTKPEEENTTASRESIDWYSLINSTTVSTDAQGIAKLDDLIAGATYTLRYLDEHKEPAEQNITVPNVTTLH